MRLSSRAALGSRSAAECLLDRVKLGDALEGLAGNRSWRRRRLPLDLHKLAPQMRPAEGERPGQGVRTRLSGHGLVSLIAVAVDDAAITLEQPQAMNGAAARCIGIDHPRRFRSGPGPVIARQRPEVAGFCPAAPGIQHRRRGLIDAELQRPAEAGADDATRASIPGRHSRPRRRAWNGRWRYRASPASAPGGKAANANDTWHR
ncbi:hypothetical protein SAMN05216337_1010127 [Bradyrhizobium brasilense]|uniref:Uncharacterized protein n=1 Tax=Bradyrhizobium brasilense TaxID=1419277 RepID=A0A1G6U7F3_9BRAD|nr:hypothetical protein SAMN05216337_1010127 [Bradyrhizobium brasilense]